MSRPLAIIGNVNVDIIVGDCPATLHPGTESMVAHGDVRPAGCVGNTALAWMALDVPFQVAANTGNDMFGDWLRTIFRAHSGAWPRESCATTFSVGIAHPDSERTFLTTHGHIEKLSLDEVKRGTGSPRARRRGRAAGRRIPDGPSERGLSGAVRPAGQTSDRCGAGHRLADHRLDSRRFARSVSVGRRTRITC